jgi:tRNA A-37 threonylcarbamoyl transferase component Bud32
MSARNRVALHQAGYVQGDIRDANIMVRKDGSLGFMLIDFDWAGEIIGKLKLGRHAIQLT